MTAGVLAVLLDLDGTLTDRPATVRAYARQFVNDFGDRFRMDDISKVVSEITRIDAHGYNRNRTSDLAAHEAWVSSPSVEALAEHWDHYFVVCTQGREGLSATINALVRSGKRLGVVTNGQTDKQRRKIEALGLHDRLGALLISEEVGIAKPNEQIFRAAAASLGVHPNECMFVGDNPEKDVRGSAAVGMRAVWFRGALAWPAALPQPHESVASLKEVLELLGLSSV